MVLVRLTLVGDREHVKPVEGETAVASETVPLKPFRPVTVIVEVPAEPDTVLTLARFADTLKSWMI